jgi:hypothetical protein
LSSWGEEGGGILGVIISPPVAYCRQGVERLGVNVLLPSSSTFTLLQYFSPSAVPFHRPPAAPLILLFFNVPLSLVLNLFLNLMSFCCISHPSAIVRGSIIVKKKRIFPSRLLWFIFNLRRKIKRG